MLEELKKLVDIPLDANVDGWEVDIKVPVDEVVVWSVNVEVGTNVDEEKEVEEMIEEKEEEDWEKNVVELYGTKVSSCKQRAMLVISCRMRAKIFFTGVK